MPSITIEKKVQDKLLVERCPFCGSDNVRANFHVGGIYSEGKVSAWVICNSCGHKVETSGYDVDENSLLQDVVKKWNAQTKMKSNEYDDRLKSLKSRVENLERELCKIATTVEILMRGTGSELPPP